jgi:YHS domain-containing protein
MEVRDPVCGMQLEDDTAPETSVHDGTTYYFCSATCKQMFDQHPEYYLSEIPQSMR